MSALYDPERVAEILVDAFTLGDGTAARKWRITTRTVRNYRVRLKTDTELSAIFHQKRVTNEDELSTLRVRFLRRALAVLEEKITAPEAAIYDIAGAVKIVGELHQVAEALDERSDSEDPDAAEAPGDSAPAHH